MDLQEIRKKLDSKQIGAAELTKSYLDAIDQKDMQLNSYITVCHETALQEAAQAQMIIDSGKAATLTGIPLSIKDNICAKGIRATCASKMLEDFVPPYNATVIDKLHAQHSVILGKTNMDEFAMGGSSQTSYFGGVHNPYETTRVPGGSSGGAAAAVAAGLCCAALGSDTGGSVRQPASFCGVTGLKPTYGAVSRCGLIAFASSLDQIGILARRAADAGYILNAVAGYDANDATSSRIVLGDATAHIGMDIRGLRIGLPKEFFSAGISPDVRTAVLDAAKWYENAGCKIIDTSLPSLEYAVAAYYLISSAEAASNLSRFDGIKYGYRSEKGDSFAENIAHTRREGFGDEVKRRILLGNYALSSGYYDAYYQNASRIRAQIKKEYHAIFTKCDFILTPTTPTTAYPIGYLENDPVKMYLADICTVSVNIAGLPAVSTPCGYDQSGLPIGMSLTGRPFSEKSLIGICDAFEQDFHRKEAV